MSGSVNATDGDVHVLPIKTGWIVTVEGSGRRPLKHWSQRDAIRRARGLAQEHQSELLIHGRNGRVRARSTYR